MFNFRNYKSHTYLYENINEALIRSYSIDSVKKYLQHFFKDIKLSIESFEYNPYYTIKKPANNAFVGIKIYDNFNIYEKVIEKCNNLYGWFTSSIIVNHASKAGYKNIKFDRICENEKFKYYQDYIHKEINEYIVLLNKSNIKTNYIELVIEAKHPRLVVDKPKYMYHLTDKRNLSKIEKHGLIPKSKGNFPERIYLSYNKDDLLDMLEGRYNNEIEDNRLLLKVNVDNVKLYHDDRRDDAVFTYDNIPFNSIEIEKLL